MPFLSIFTPTYNRSNTLPRVYESLKNQSCKDFEWIIVDDGSTDDTVSLVDEWLGEEEFSIRYFYKKNGGLHTAYNLAIDKMDDSVLAVCIDSDDFMPSNAVELIKNKWLTSGSEKYGGIIGLDYDMCHNLIGGELTGEKIDVIDFVLGKLDILPGDKKYVCRTDLYKSTGSQPEFEGEKYFNPSWRNKEVARNHRCFLIINEEICTVDYQPTGLSKNKFKQYLNSPHGYMEIRKQLLSFSGMPIKKLLSTIIHYDSEALLAGCFFKEMIHSRYAILMFVCLPIGKVLSVLTRVKAKDI